MKGEYCGSITFKKRDKPEKREFRLLTVTDQFEVGIEEVLGLFDSSISWDAKLMFDEYYRNIPNTNFQVNVMGCDFSTLDDVERRIKLNKELDEERGYIVPKSTRRMKNDLEDIYKEIMSDNKDKIKNIKSILEKLVNESIIKVKS